MKREINSFWVFLRVSLICFLISFFASLLYFFWISFSSKFFIRLLSSFLLFEYINLACLKFSISCSCSNSNKDCSNVFPTITVNKGWTSISKSNKSPSKICVASSFPNFCGKNLFSFSISSYSISSDWIPKSTITTFFSFSIKLRYISIPWWTRSGFGINNLSLFDIYEFISFFFDFFLLFFWFFCSIDTKYGDCSTLSGKGIYVPGITWVGFLLFLKIFFGLDVGTFLDNIDW